MGMNIPQKEPASTTSENTTPEKSKTSKLPAEQVSPTEIVQPISKQSSVSSVIQSTSKKMQKYSKDQLMSVFDKLKETKSALGSPFDLKLCPK